MSRACNTTCIYRAAEECESPLVALEVALDAMCAMAQPFHDMFHILSAVRRRVSGEDVVQFASIINTDQQV